MNPNSVPKSTWTAQQEAKARQFWAEFDKRYGM